MEVKKSKTDMDEMPAFDEELDSLNFDDSSFLDESDPAIPIVNDLNDFEKEEGLTSAELDENAPDLSSGTEETGLESDFDVDLNDFSHSGDESGLEEDFGEIQGGLEGERETEIISDSSVTLEDEEGPVSLSDEELGSILDLTEKEETSSASSDLTFDSSIGEDFSMPEMPLEEEEEDIALSSSELDNILGDTDTTTVLEAEAPSEDSLLSREFDQDFFGEEAGGGSFEDISPELIDSDFDTIAEGPEEEIVESMEDTIPGLEEETFAGEIQPSGILEDEDEGPIALTPEELGNIESDVNEGVEPISEEAPRSILDEEDEGPIAFDETEMASILENITEEEQPPEAENVEGVEKSMPYGVDLDELESTAAVAEAPPAGGDLKKEELKKMISYLDSLFDDLPDETVRKFSKSEYFELYKKIMSDLGINS